MTSNSLLLRLFNSEFFTSWLAISYVFKYPDSVGIQHYLCNELKKFPLAEIEFFLPQICHLLISRPEQSTSLENFLLDRCKISSHLAILTFWYLQAYMSDLSAAPHSPSYRLCKRMHSQVQNIIFTEGCDDSTELPKRKAKVRENPFPALVGMSALLAGIVSPAFALGAGQMAIEQGRRAPFYPPVKQVDDKANVNSLATDEKGSASESLGAENLGASFNLSSGSSRIPTSSPTLEDLHKGRAFSFGHYIKSTAGRRSFERISTLNLSPSRSFDRRETESYSEATSPVPDTDSDFEYDLFLGTEPSRRKQLIEGHYFHSEMSFVIALVDISNRLCMLPKKARISSLHAELSLLNHNLPADVCIPLWCPATADNPYHHKIVRIPPSDAVVLNSAEKAPYLIMVEVIETDADFDESVLLKYKPAVPVQTEETDSESDSSDSSHELTQSGAPTTGASPRSLDITEFEEMKSQPSPNTSKSNKEYFEKVITRRSSSAADGFAEHMRTAAVMLAQLTERQTKETGRRLSNAKAADASGSGRNQSATDMIREKIIHKMMALEEARIAKMKLEGIGSGVGGDGGEGGGGETLEDDGVILESVKHKDDPSAAVFQEDWNAKKERIRASSPYGSHPNWQLFPVIVKTGGDLRQEQLALQLILVMQKIWKEAEIDIWVKYYRILVTSDSSGFIETIRNTISLHSLKKEGYTKRLNQQGVVFTLYDYFVQKFGTPDSPEFLRAQDNFMRSLVGYSLVCYILHLKDRHNGNVLLATDGHLIHIDFGFMLSNTPGSVGFEMAPFKLTQEYLDVLGGVESEKFAEFKALFKQGFLALRKFADNIILLVDIMQKDSSLPCFSNTGESTVAALRDRFQLSLTETQVDEYLDKLIISSCCNVFTRLYDTFQYYSNGIL
ncbi:kinase-like protein [Basidiobolus meristosporus CBS 931.73]|uniref:1-phosphatidylinositol 4-kinase n=1 Tax=Basidiobolus meristosporus CBS 931.73 TaxID=1314790 RepID=A0A1Y1ZBU4_9FUNG|nr:kinase-like protein [Basidiobolus meristosporus CBS 931.73]|eukprot:ORY07447.1 kinase-like protein [Basidiobolus meristosporus CBS 931.73]